MTMKLIERRVGLLFALFTIAFLGVMVRAAWLQAVRGGDLSAEARLQQTAEVTVPGIRGSILDSSGRELAVSQDAATLYVTPYQVEDPKKAAQKLAPLLDEDSAKVLEVLTAKSGFEYLARQVDLVTANKVDKLGLAGVGSLPDSRRIYPSGDIGSRLIGAVSADNSGLFGIEDAENSVLAGTDGQVSVTRDGLGQEIGRDTVDGADPGGNVQLTIDAKIQAQTEKVLAQVGEAQQPTGATAIAVNPQDGSVLAMASWPPVDPTDLSSASPELLGNMATNFNYEPGSTFKAFTIAGALEDGVVKPNTSFTLPPSIQVADRTIEESHPRGTETLTTSGILKVSSNVGAVTIGLQLNKGEFGKRFDYWVRRFGFSKPTGFDLGEEQGLVPSPKDYSGSTMGNLPIGQGLSVTPLQMVAAYSAIANGGTLRPPHVIESVDGTAEPAPAGTRVISEKTSRQLRTMLEGVLEPGGTASVEIPGYVLAGKTGTAQKVVDGQYSESQYIASFVGFAPAEDPQLLIAVIVDDPKGDYYGGSVAAPAFGEIAQFALQYLGIPPN